MLLARVALPVPLGQAFTYSVDATLEAGVRRGARVLCEFGKRRAVGVVLEVGERAPDVPLDKLKPILALVDAEPALPEELLGFLQELARYYVAPIGDVIELALPAVERSAAPSLEEPVSGQAPLALFAEKKAPLARMVGKLVQVVEAVAGADGEAPRGQAQGILTHLRESGPTELRALGERWPNARAAVAKLDQAGLVRVTRKSESIDPFTVDVPKDTPPVLNPEQERAVRALCDRLERNEQRSFLLEGVTASGKTEVYLRAAERCLELGRGVLVLVPEIALTPQLVGRFRARLGKRIAVIHSGLRERERYAMWRSLRDGEARVAVGARSALFAPLDKLGLICVDEEHDGSFKQEEGVRYHARDMALLRAHRAGAVCVLGSATPSITTIELAHQGKLDHLELRTRAPVASRLPEIEIVDLRRLGPGLGGERLLTVPLVRALERTLAAKEQAILFLNRRGFSPSLVCDACGEIAQCPNCSIALTLHRARGARLICHYCDYSTATLNACPSCKAPSLVEEGAGTERIEATLAQALPNARIARLDRDVAAGLKSEKVLDRVRRGEVDVLVGTQMVTKGHDLPNVTLVGVLNADAALAMPDFRAAERTFQLLVQVAGRAGRSSRAGRVLIQAYQPQHPAIQLAAAHDTKGFAEAELAARRELRYPPFSRLALVRFDAVEEAAARDTAERIAVLARKWAEDSVEILGPAPAPLARLRNRYRYRFLARSVDRTRLHLVLLAVARTAVDRRVRMAIDVDPVSML